MLAEHVEVLTKRPTEKFGLYNDTISRRNLCGYDVLTTCGIMVMLDRRASKLTLSVSMPSKYILPSVRMQRSSARVRVDFPEPVRPTAWSE